MADDLTASQMTHNARLRCLIRLSLSAQHCYFDPTGSARSETPHLYHFDSKFQHLKLWPWPCYPDARRVPPDELDHYSAEFDLRKPCCLCALGRDTACYTEAEVIVLEATEVVRNDPLMRPFIGEYVAKCATNKCGYFVAFERFYRTPVLLVKSYAKRSGPKSSRSDWQSPAVESNHAAVRVRMRGLKRGCREAYPPGRGYSKKKKTIVAQLGGLIRGDVPEELSRKREGGREAKALSKKPASDEEIWEDEVNALLAEVEEDLAELQALRDAMFPR